jgi:copper chaperone CopZ
MKRMNAIAAAGAAILAIGAYLAGSELLAPASSEVAAVAGASPTAAPSPASPSSQAAELETVLAEFGVFAPTSSEMAAATGVPSSRAMSSAAGAALVSQAATLETVALKVDGMWCPSCAYFVHQALTRTAGVLDAKVSGRKGTAVVRYDPSKTTVAALIAATTGYGYPAQVIR